MITLRLFGSPLPLVLITNTRYTFTVLKDGENPLFVRWTVSNILNTLLEGTGNISTTFLTSETHFINVTVTNKDGSLSAETFTLSVASNRSTPVETGVVWDNLTFSEGSTVSGRVIFKDPTGDLPKTISWELLRNNRLILSGDSVGEFVYNNASAGVYKLNVTATDLLDNSTSASSTSRVSGEFGTQGSVIHPQPEGTMQYLGTVYSPNYKIESSQATTLPEILASYSVEEYLITGSTHYKLEIDYDDVPDYEVSVRTNGGNYPLVGPPNGLAGEDVGYDYTQSQPFVASPDDQRMKVTVDVFKVNGLTVTAFNFRIKIKCYRTGPTLYRYTPCEVSYYGTRGPRQRRWAFTVSDVYLQTDTESPLNRLRTEGASIHTLTADTTTNMVSLAEDGSPDIIQKSLGISYTRENVITTYEPVDGNIREIDGKAIYGIESFRPFVTTLIEASNPPVSHRIQRIKGKLIAYMSGGVIDDGATVTATIYTGSGSIDVVLTVVGSIKSPGVNTYMKVAEATLDLSDFQFSGGSGLVIDITVDETTATGDDVTGCPYDPTPGPEEVFSILGTDGINVDGACYTLMGQVDEFLTGDIVGGTPIEGCYEDVCGPQGLYCYTNIANGTTILSIPQPLHFPAPVVSLKNDIANCYNSPLFNGTVSGVTPASPVFVTTGTGQCGRAYDYTPCNGGNSIAVIFPLATSAHTSIKSGSICYALNGTVTDTTPFPLVDRNDVSVVPSCLDVECTGSNALGYTLDYTDCDTLEKVDVQFINSGTRIPAWGVSDELVDSGVNNLISGKQAVRFDNRRPDHQVIARAPGTGTLDFRFSENISNVSKRIIVDSGGSVSTFLAPPGTDFLRIPLVEGSSVKISASDVDGRVSVPMSGVVFWEPYVSLPRVYDTTTFSFIDYPNITADNGIITADSDLVTADGRNLGAPPGSSVVIALGFKGLSNRTDYSLFETLPADVATEFPNPDSIVTVQGDGSSVEHVLIRSRAIGDNVPSLPAGSTWYTNQQLQAPMIFRFYASRDFQGAHGQMDVWVDTDQLWPEYLRVNEFKTLKLEAGFSRKNSDYTNTQRRSIDIAPNCDTGHYPYVYAASDGEKISVRVAPADDYPTIVLNGKVYSRTLRDDGISYHVRKFSTGAPIAADLGDENFTDFALLADWGFDSPEEASIANLIKTLDPSYIIGLGDNNYPDGSASTLPDNIPKYYGDYTNTVSPAFNRLFMIMGNHDLQADPLGGPLLDYMGSGIPKTYSNGRIYTITKGPVQFFMFNSGITTSGDYVEPLGNDSESAQRDLMIAEVAASSASWKVACIHHPLWSSDTNYGPGYPILRWIADLGFDLILQGHAHVYERLNVDGQNYLTCPAGALSTRTFGTPVAGSIVRDSFFGYMRGTASTGTLTVEAVDISGTLRDTLMLTH